MTGPEPDADPAALMPAVGPLEALGAALHSRRLERGLEVVDVARIMGVGIPTVEDWEAGELDLSATEVIALDHALGLRPGTLLQDAGLIQLLTFSLDEGWRDLRGKLLGFADSPEEAARFAEIVQALDDAHRLRWLRGHPWDPGDTYILTGPTIRCAGCGRGEGVAAVAIVADPDAEPGDVEPRDHPDWPFPERGCPLCRLTHERLKDPDAEVIVRALAGPGGVRHLAATRDQARDWVARHG